MSKQFEVECELADELIETLIDSRLSKLSHEELKEIVKTVLQSIIIPYGQIDGDHHKTWVIDQIVRKLMGYKYDTFIKAVNYGKDGPDTYEWDTGIAP